MKLVYGLHQPKYVSDTNVIRYSEKLGLQGEIYRLKDYSEENRSKYRYLGNKFPDVLVFNSIGQLTKFEIDCSGNLDSIVKLSPYDIDKMSIQENTLQDFIGDTYIINSLGNEDLTFNHIPLYIIKFAEFAGKLNKDNVPELVARLNYREDVQYILLNLDYSVNK